MSGSERAARAGGFTLLELLVVIAVLAAGAVAVAAIPAAPRGADRLDAGAAAVLRLVRAARVEALAGGAPRAVLIDAARGVVALGSDGREVRLGPDVALSATFAREAATDGAPAILFFPDGTSTGGTLTLRGGGRERRITVHWLSGGVDAAG